MSNISNLKANNPGLFARPNQFEVTFTNPRGTNDVPSPGNNKTLRHLQMEKAKQGDVRMLIWLGKQYLDQKDTPTDQENTAPLPWEE